MNMIICILHVYGLSVDYHNSSPRWPTRTPASVIGPSTASMRSWSSHCLRQYRPWHQPGACLSGEDGFSWIIALLPSNKRICKDVGSKNDFLPC